MAKNWPPGLYVVHCDLDKKGSQEWKDSKESGSGGVRDN